MILNKDEAKIVKLIFEKFCNERLTQSDIAKYLTSKKIPTRSDTDPKSKSKSRN
ncbi:TPA: hypothetical protein DEG21_03285 [Patescibacteria group bacterium]|nr:hypothetical protein [Candidatus Gracilibacteria bacterium]HBY74883.1 hypothetical protein [Candidatus Gracilibacteria bacterium]